VIIMNIFNITTTSTTTTTVDFCYACKKY